jgi:ATP-dependent Zn protease
MVRDHSEQTAREIDEEVKRIIDDMGQRSRRSCSNAGRPWRASPNG